MYHIYLSNIETRIYLICFLHSKSFFVIWISAISYLLAFFVTFVNVEKYTLIMIELKVTVLCDYWYRKMQRTGWNIRSLREGSRTYRFQYLQDGNKEKLEVRLSKFLYLIIKTYFRREVDYVSVRKLQITKSTNSILFKKKKSYWMVGGLNVYPKHAMKIKTESV